MSAYEHYLPDMSRAEHIKWSANAMRSSDAKWLRILPEKRGMGVQHVVCPQSKDAMGVGVCVGCPHFVGIPPLTAALLCKSDV